MANLDELKKIKKALLEVAEEQEIERGRQDLIERGLYSEGNRELGLIRVKYAHKRQLIEDEFDDTFKEKEDSIRNETSPNERSQFLPNNGKKNLKLRRLQNLFIKQDTAPFDLIAKEIGLHKTKGEYILKDRKKIISLQKQFNQYSKKSWKMILSSTRGVQGISFDGLRIIIPTNQR